MKVLAAAVLLAVAHPDAVPPVGSAGTRPCRGAACGSTTGGAVAGEGRLLAAAEPTRQEALEASATRKLATYTSCAGEEDEDPCTAEYLEAKEACSAAGGAHPACGRLEQLRELRAVAVEERRGNDEARSEREFRAWWWESRRWPVPEQRRFLAGCREKYREQGPLQAEVYCACMLELLIDDHPRSPRSLEESEVPSFRERTAWMRRDCGEFAGLTPED